MTGSQDFFNLLKTIVDNYMTNRKPAAVVLGTYNGTAVVLHSKLPVPMSLIEGNLKQYMVSGDRLRLLRNDGGGAYYILEIIGRPYQTGA